MDWTQKIITNLLLEDTDEVRRYRKHYERLKAIKEPTKAEIMALHGIANALKQSGTSFESETQKKAKENRTGSERRDASRALTPTWRPDRREGGRRRDDLDT